MRDKLKEKYIPHHYHTRFLEQYNAVRQGSPSVVDYIMRFAVSRLRCGVRESPKMTITRCKMRLRPEIQKELIPYYITTLEQIYMIAQDKKRYVSPVAPQPQDPMRMDVRPKSGRQPPRVSPNPSRIDPVLNRGKEEAKGHLLSNPNRCYRCRGISHQSTQCPTRREHALFIKDIVEEVQRDDDETGINEIVDHIHTPSDDGGERGDNCLAVMRPYSSYPSPQTPIWVVRCTLTHSTPEED